MRVVLIQPPQPTSTDDRLNPPMGLMYVAASVRGHKYTNIDVVDLSSIPEEEWGDTLGTADVYGVTMYTTSFSICRKIASVTKELNPNSIFVVGGPHPTSLPELTMEEDWIDIVVAGEGEDIFPTVLKEVEAGFTSTIGTIFKGGRVDLSTIPLPAFDLVDYDSYSRQVNNRRAPAVYTLRGCQYNCSFCYRDMFGRIVRYFPLEHIDGILSHFAEEGYTDICVWDSFFTNRRSRWHRIADMLHNYGFSYRCNGKIGVDTKEDFRKLADTGCSLLNTGLESGSQYLIDRMKKKFTMDQARDYINGVRDAGLTFRAFLQFGFPGETRRTMEETMRFIEDVDIDQYSCFTHAPFPGSNVYKNPEEYGITWLSSDWDDYFLIAGTDGLGGMPFSTEWLSREEALDLNREFVEWIRRRQWRGGKELYHKKVGI